MKNRAEWTDWAAKRLARKLATEDFERETAALGSAQARTGIDSTGCAVPKAAGKYPGILCPYCGKPQ
jgi:hypothetical protein